MTALLFEWADGFLEFDESDTVRVRTIKNRNQLIKQFQNRKHMIYSKGDVWLTFVLSSQSLEKMETLRNISGQVNFYYDYANNPGLYKTVSVDKNMSVLYRAGYQDGESEISLKFIEAEAEAQFTFRSSAIVQEVMI